MKIEHVNVYSSLSFKHTSSDYYIKTGRYINLDRVCKNVFRDFDPWYKKLFYPIEDLADFISRKFKRK